MKWISVKERFEANIFPEPNTGCWLWSGHTLWNGYGVMKVHSNRFKAHRFSWMIYRDADLTSKQLVLHKCDTPSCVNPDHLYLGDQKQNAADRDSRGRNGFSRKTHCKRGHEFTEANTYRHNGKRICRACKTLPPPPTT